MELSKLKDSIAYQWKIQGFTKNKEKAICVAYIDSRDAQSLLDLVCWPENWSSEFYEVKGKLFCKVGIYINNQWVYKSDSGALEASDNVDIETTSKGESSDAFKRACVQWGIGRFLYDMEIKYIPASEYEANKYRLTEYINWLNNWPKTNGTAIQGTTTAKEYITGLQVQSMLMDYKEGKIQVASAESLIEKAQQKYRVAQWAKDKFTEGFNSIKK